MAVRDSSDSCFVATVFTEIPFRSSSVTRVQILSGTPPGAELGPGATMVLEDVQRRPPIDVVGDDLAVDHGLVRERLRSTRDRSEARGEVFAVAREQSHLPSCRASVYIRWRCVVKIREPFGILTNWKLSTFGRSKQP